MKRSFKNIIDETFRNSKSWDYYADVSIDFDYNPMDSIENAKKFLKKFISIAGKGEGLLYQEIDKLKERATHVVAAFFIGHYVYNNIDSLKKLIDSEIKKLVNENEVKSDVCFSFIWFLTCLYHDLGYEYEEKEIPEFKDYDALSKSVENHLLQINGIPKFYNQIYKNYFKYRLKEHKKNDHGIVAAHLMYDSLYKIRETADKRPNKIQKELCWEKELLVVYNFCAWNILGHNIWYGSKCKPYDVIKYTKHKMKRLLLECNQVKIKLKDHPFFFFFCLIDTIEPFKKILDYDALEKVYLDLNDSRMIISTDLKCGCGQSVINQAKSLNHWLVKTTKKLNIVEIYFNE